jgi:hypothetical protein
VGIYGRAKLKVVTSDPIERYLADHGAKLEKRERLKAMTPSEVVNMALRVYRQLGWTFLTLTVVPSLFCLAAIAFVIDYVLPSLTVTHHESSINGQLGEAGVSFLLALFVGGPLFLLGLSYMSAVVIHLTSAYMSGKNLDPEAAVRSARRLVPTLFQVSLRELVLSSSGVIVSLVLMGLGAVISQYTSSDSPAGGFILLLGCFGIAAGIFVFLYVVSIHGLAPAIAVIEDVGGRSASRRSTWLMKAQWAHGSGVSSLLNAFLLMALAGSIEWFGFEAMFSVFDLPRHVEDLVSGSPIGGLLEAAFGLLPSFLVVWTVLPLWATCVTIVYYERRIRLEGFDIEVLADEIGKSGRTSRFDV